MSSTSIPTPRLCRKSPDASPLATSGYCLASPIAAVALTCLPKTAVLAAGETRPRQRAAAVAGHDYLAQGRRRCGLLAAVALGAWQSATGQALTAPITKPETVVIRGLVLDDSLNVPVPGLFLYLNDTKYGAITDERGEFTFNYPAAWKPVRGGVLSIQATPVPYTFSVYF